MKLKIQVAIELAICVLCIFIIIPSATGLSTKGYSVYQADTFNTVFGKNYTASGFSASNDTLQNIGGQARFLIIKSSYDRNESIIVSEDNSTHIDMVVVNMSDPHRGTIYTNQFTTTGPNINYRSIDVAYEYNSGRALIVWDANGNNRLISYSIWNGTALSINSTFTVPSASSTSSRYIKLVQRPGSNDIMAVFNDGLSDISAILWNGTSWVSGLYATASGTSVSSRRPMDFAWMKNGDGVFFYSNAPGSPNNGVYYQYFNYSSKTWGAQTLAMASTIASASTTRQVQACPNPQNNYIGVIFMDSSADTYAFMWNGTDVETTPGPPTADGTSENAGDNVQCEWEKNGKQALFTYVRNAALSLNYFTYDLSPDLSTRSWSTATLAGASNTGNIGNDDIEVVTTDASPTNDNIMVVFKDLAYSVNSTLWNGSSMVSSGANSLITTTSTAGPTPSATVQSYSYTWSRLGLRSPVFSGTVEDNSDSITPTNEGANVTFNASATNPYGSNWYLLVCYDADEQDGACGPAGQVCKSADQSSAAIATCSHNTTGEASEEYSWYAYACNDLGACSSYDFTNSPYDVNHAPTLSPYLSTYAPNVTDTITCFANASDTDVGDSITNVFAWYQQNESTGPYNLIAGETSNQLSAPEFDSNDKIICQVTSTDNHGFSSTPTNTSAALVEQGNLSAAMNLTNTTVFRTQSTTINATCAVSAGDSEDVVLNVQDNRTGSFTQSSTSSDSIYVSTAAIDLGRLASQQSPIQTITIYTTTAGTYNIRVQCVDNDTNNSVANSTAKQLSVVLDTTPPVISGAQAINIGEKNAQIVWTTDDYSDNTVNYGTDPSLPSSVVDPTLVQSHSITILSLTRSTQYYYNVTSCNIDGYCSVAGEFTFTTTNGVDETSPSTEGQCTGITTEASPDHVDGYLKNNETYLFYCELPNNVYKDQSIGISISNKDVGVEKTVTMPSLVYGNQMVVYP